MNNDINVLLCFDSNYNIQAEVTINSLLNNSTKFINFYIIHDSPESFNKNKLRILDHKNTNEVNVYKFVRREGLFSKFEKSHMTEATYYRLFIADYIPKNVGEIMYIDPDIICINNFDLLYQTTVENLKVLILYYLREQNISKNLTVKLLLG